MTLVPWQSGHSATWDMTVVHTLAASYVSQSSIQAGNAAEAASDRKAAKYTSLSPSYLFFSGGCGDPWYYGGRGTRVRAGDRQKGHS